MRSILSIVLGPVMLVGWMTPSDPPEKAIPADNQLLAWSDTTTVLADTTVFGLSGFDSGALKGAPLILQADSTDWLSKVLISRGDLRLQPFQGDCHLDAVDPGMVHEPDTSLDARIATVPPSSRVHASMPVITPCPAVSDAAASSGEH